MSLPSLPAAPNSASPAYSATATPQPPTLYYAHNQQQHNPRAPPQSTDNDALPASAPSPTSHIGKRQRSSTDQSAPSNHHDHQSSNGHTSSHSPTKAASTPSHTRKPSRRTTNKQRLQELLSEIDWSKFNEVIDLMKLDPTAVTSLVADHASTTARGNSSLYLQLMLTSLAIPFASVFGVTNQQSGQRERLDHSTTAIAAASTLLKQENSRSGAWVDDDNKQLLELRQKGLAFPDIARLMDRTLGSVKKHYYALTNTKPEAGDSDDEEKVTNAEQSDVTSVRSPDMSNTNGSASGAQLTDYAVRAAAEQVNSLADDSTGRLQHNSSPFANGDNGESGASSPRTSSTAAGTKVMHPWRQSEKQKADSMKLEGCSLAEIARALDRTVKSVDGHFKRQRARIKREAALEQKAQEGGQPAEPLMSKTHNTADAQQGGDEHSQSGSSVSQQELLSSAVARATQHQHAAAQLIDPVHSHHHHQHQQQHHGHDTHHSDAHTVPLPTLAPSDFAAQFTTSDSMDDSQFHHHHTSIPLPSIIPSTSNSLQSLSDPMYHTVHTPPAYNLQPPATQPQLIPQLPHNLNHYR